MTNSSAESISCRYTKEEVLQKVATVPFWGHHIPLPYGVVTPGRVMKNQKTVRRLHLPDVLSGKRVLDIGAWDGFYSFECERRGASVLAIDNLNRMQRPDEIEHASQGNRGFEIAKDILGSHVDFKDMDVYDLAPENVGMFDVVLFLGVLYHLKHPMLALEKIAAVTTGMLIMETEWLRTPFARRALLEYLEADSFNSDPTNFCSPNTRWIKAVLRDCGFKKIEILYQTPLWKSALKSVRYLSLFANGRIVVKAWK